MNAGIRENHPNPQFMRRNYELLDGEWDFCFDNENVGLKESYYNNSKWGNNLTINVPYCYQSKNSSIGISDSCQVVWYKKVWNLPSNWNNNLNKNRILFHIEASDYKTTVFVNGSAVGTHEGGHTPFAFDITDFVKEKNNLIAIRVEDESTQRFILGKQSYTNKNFGCWYTRTTGIWQSVWAELVPETYISKFRFVPHTSTGELEVIAEVRGRFANESLLSINITSEDIFMDKSVPLNRSLTATVHNNLAKFRISVHDTNFQIPVWSVESPNLCNVVFKLQSNSGEDEVLSYFGYRNIKIFGNQVYINDKPYYQKLILNQGYYPNGLLTGSEEEFLHDCNMIKSMGFNGMRIHQKIESSRLLYHADRLGILVWAELPSFYSNDPFNTVNIFNELSELVLKHANHPSVITWTPFNESWGVNSILTNVRDQQITIAGRELIIALDYEHRPVICNDGWEHTLSDILTIHDYNQDSKYLEAIYHKRIEDMNFDLPQTNSSKRFYAEGFEYSGEPIILSEYGGIGFVISKFSDSDWGYGNIAKSEAEFYQRFEDMHKVIFDLDYLCGVCYTQLTDVEQEINGLLDRDHKPKFDVAKIADILNAKRSV